MNKVIINDCYGGFGYSPLAIAEIYKRKHPDTGEIFFYKEKDFDWKTCTYSLEKCKNPEDSDYAVIKDLGDNCNETIASENNPILLEDIWERHDPDCIAIVEELGDKANGKYAKLQVVEIPDDKYIIHEYDGWEWLETPSSPKEWIEIK